MEPVRVPLAVAPMMTKPGPGAALYKAKLPVNARDLDIGTYTLMPSTIACVRLSFALLLQAVVGRLCVVWFLDVELY